MANRAHILLVEDELLVLETLQEILEADYRVSSVRTVSEACACLLTSHIDVAIVDWQLPDGSGDAVAVVAAQYGVPIIAMSGYPDDMNYLEQRRRPYLMKPFGACALEETLRAVLDGRPPDGSPPSPGAGSEDWIGGPKTNG
jgi:DNA-binding response OmpR family regulator